MLITSYHIYEALLSPESNKPNPWYTTEEGYHRTVSKYLSEHPDIDMLGLYENGAHEDTLHYYGGR